MAQAIETEIRERAGLPILVPPQREPSGDGQPAESAPAAAKAGGQAVATDEVAPERPL
jgi:hypothetical protein